MEGSGEEEEGTSQRGAKRRVGVLRDNKSLLIFFAMLQLFNLTIIMTKGHCSMLSIWIKKFLWKQWVHIYAYLYLQ